MTLKWAIVGIGGSGKGHARMVEHAPGMELVGGYDPDEAACRTFRSAHAGRLYDSYEALLADKTVDGVTISSPSVIHGQQAVAALAAGKCVLVEKPFALDAAEARRMIAAAAAARRVLAPFHNRRFDPDFLMVREVLASGVLGRIRRVHSFIGGPSPMDGWRTVRAAAGGRLYDWGPHLLDQVLNLNASAVTDVWGATHVLAERGDADDYFRAELRFADGLDATVEMSGFSYLPPLRWEALGETGTLQVTGNIHGDFAMTVCTDGAEPRTTATTAAAEKARRGDGGAMIYQALVAHVAGRGELAVTPADALRVAEVMDAIRRSTEAAAGAANS